MQNFVINLDRSDQRWRQMELLFRSLNIPIERHSAIDGQKLTEALPYYASGKRVMLPGEYATMKSHLGLWERLANSNDAYCVIFEDDLIASQYLSVALKLIDEDRTILDTFEIIRLEAFSKNVRIDRRQNYRLGRLMIRELKSSESGLAAYVLSKRGAEKLVAAYKHKALLSDDLFIRDNMEAFGITVGQVHPALVVQDSRSQHFGLPSRGVEQTFMRPRREKKLKGTRRMIKNIRNEYAKFIVSMTHLRRIITDLFTTEKLRMSYFDQD